MNGAAHEIQGYKSPYQESLRSPYITALARPQLDYKHDLHAMTVILLLVVPTAAVALAAPPSDPMAGGT